MSTPTIAEFYAGDEEQLRPYVPAGMCSRTGERCNGCGQCMTLASVEFIRDLMRRCDFVLGKGSIKR